MINCVNYILNIKQKYTLNTEQNRVIFNINRGDFLKKKI